MTKKSFIKKSFKIHNNRYDYKNFNYVNTCIKGEIICKTHGVFFQTPKHHLRGQGCRLCNYENKSIILKGVYDHNKKSNIHEFVEKAKKIHNNDFNYSLSVYLNARTKMEIKCNRCNNIFKIKPANHLSGYGCNICSKNKKYTTDEFIKRSIKIHDNKYDYSEVNYINNNTKIKIKCKKCNMWFFQTPTGHFRRNGCPKCAINISKPEIDFLNYVNVPNTKENRHVHIKPYNVDGYDPKTNTIYEFLGDYWHGNPKKFNHNSTNERCKKSFRELYNNTVDRFKNLDIAGYKIKYIWEDDWKKFDKKIKLIPKIKTFNCHKLL